MMKYFFEEEK